MRGITLFYFQFSEDITLLKILELKTLDTKFRIRGARPASDRIAIVAIDDNSLEMLGRWPWPRSYHAEVIDALSRDAFSKLYEDTGVKLYGYYTDRVSGFIEEPPPADWDWAIIHTRK